MDNLRCSDCKYKEDFTPSGCEKCNTCEWGLGVSDLHTNFEPIERLDYKVINRGKCMLCGKELTEGIFFCKECEAKGGKE